MKPLGTQRSNPYIAKIGRSVVVLSLLLAYSSLAIAQKGVTIADTVDQHIFSFQEIEFLEDSTRSLSIDRVVSDEYNSVFQRNVLFNPTNPNRESAYWYRIKIRHNPDTKKNWVIEFFDQTIDHLEFYEPVDSVNYSRIVLGDESVFDSRETKHKNFIVNLKPRGNQEVVYYMKVQSRQKADILVVLRSRDWLFQYALDEYFFFGIFYGMILVFGFYNLLMFIAVRESHYLYYFLYIVCVGLYEMSADGIAFQYLWPGSPGLNYYAPGVFLYLATTTALIFSGSLLNLKRNDRPVYKLFVYAFVLRTIFLVMSIAINPEWFRFRFIDILPFAVIYYASFRSYFAQRYSPARFLVAAYSFVAFGIFYKVLQYFGIEWKPFGELSHYSLGFSFVAEMLLLSFAISDKIKVLSLEKARASEKMIEQLHENQELKDNLNKTLEEQVLIKTAELIQKSAHIEEQNMQLEAANKQLEAQAREIADINTLLERDNVKLQHDVAEVKEARVLSKEVDYEEFSSTHPTEESWMKFLAEVKWAEGYACRRCRNETFSAGRGLHSRRCTKCGYDESVTAYTLLQNTRLPLGKALYMIFLVYNSRGSISSYKLSEIVGIRQSTCWHYSSRIKTLLNEKRRSAPNLFQAGWKSIITEG
jgi:two-component system, sensor histidine kinase LadS